MNGSGVEDIRGVIGASMVGYVVVMIAISALAQRRIASVEDYVLAGRRLSFWLATPTLLATWFGAGTLLTAADEVRARGVEAAALDPVGAGFCLLIAGAVFAGPLYRLRLTTLADFFRLRFGARAELMAAVLMVPQYVGWLAAQFIALAHLLELFFGIPVATGMALVAAIGAFYTLLGGMWAVTLTDALQMGVIVAGLAVMAFVVLAALGDGELAAGMLRLGAETPAEKLRFVPVESAERFVGWIGVLCAGALGNIPSQDLLQRIFSARSERAATGACYAAGGLYLVLGAFPVGLGLAGALLAPGGGDGDATLPMLAGMFLHPALAVVFVVTLMSTILSTIDSALLAPATVLAQNVFARSQRLARRPLLLNRAAVLLVAVASLAAGYAGESAWGLLESSYELGMVSLLAPLTLGLFGRLSPTGALVAMATGTVAWMLHQAAGAETFLGLAGPVPVGLTCMAAAFAAGPLFDRARARDLSG